MPTKKKTKYPVARFCHAPRKKYAISRMDQVDNSTLGYYVRLPSLGISTFFGDGRYEGKTKARLAAEAFRDQQCNFLTESQQLRASLPRKSMKKKTVTKGGK